MVTLLTILHVLICLFLITVVLLQSGRAGGMGVLSGAATQTVFGGRGAGDFLQRTTAVGAILFMVTCSTLAWLSSATRDRSLGESTPATSHPATSTSTHHTTGSGPAPQTGTAGAGTVSPPPSSPQVPVPGEPAPQANTPAPAAAPTPTTTPPNTENSAPIPPSGANPPAPAAPTATH